MKITEQERDDEDEQAFVGEDLEIVSDDEATDVWAKKHQKQPKKQNDDDENWQ